MRVTLERRLLRAGEWLLLIGHEIATDMNFPRLAEKVRVGMLQHQNTIRIRHEERKTAMNV